LSYKSKQSPIWESQDSAPSQSAIGEIKMASTVRMKALLTAQPAESPGGIQTQQRKSVRVPSQSAIGEKSLATELRRKSGNAVGFRNQERRETLVPSQSTIGEIKMAGTSRGKASPTARPGHPSPDSDPLERESVLLPSQSVIGEIKAASTSRPTFCADSVACGSHGGV
jgi:hypothetical protein